MSNNAEQALTADFGQEQEIISLYKECHDFAFQAWSPFLTEAAADLRCALGDQWDHQDRQYLASQKRNALTFNRVRRNIKMITGYERRTRHSIIAQPIENSDELTANQLTELMLWVYNRENMHNMQSDAFEGALKTGINLLQLSMDFNEDSVNGDIKLNRLPYNAFLLDPRFTKRDLGDCEYIIQRQLLGRDAVKALLPFRADDIDLLKGHGPDGMFNGMQNFGSNRIKDTFRYDEFWRRKFKTERKLIDRDSGEVLPIDPEKVSKQRINEVMRFFPSLALVEKQVPTVELAIIVEDIVMFAGEDPLGIGDFPHVPVMAFWNPEHFSGNHHFNDGTPGRSDYGGFFNGHQTGDFALKLQSLVRCIRDPQTEANKRRSKMLDILDSQLNSGWQAKSGSVVNEEALHQSGQGQVIWMEDDAQMTDAQRLNAPDIPPGLFQLQQQMDKDIVDIAGVTEELLGAAEDGSGQMSGVMVKLRQGAGLTTLQDLFDNYRLSQKLVGKKMIKAIQANWGPQKIARIINEEPSPEFFPVENGGQPFGKYDISVEEAIETPTQRALAYSQLVQARQIGIPIPDSIIIDYMPLQDKKALREAMDAEAQRQQAIQAQQLEGQQRLNELQRAKVFADVGLGVERIARAEADRGLAQERISELQENNSQAVLNRIKAIKEIEEMDTNRLLRMLDFFKGLENQQIAQNAAVQQANEARAQQDLNTVRDFVTDRNAVIPGSQGGF